VKPLALPSRLVIALHVGVLLVGLFATRSARADAGSPGRDQDAHVVSALYTPTRTDDGIQWDARWVLSQEVVASLGKDDTVVLRFARALPEDETMSIERPFPGVSTLEPLEEGRRLVGVRVPASLVDARTVHAVLVQRVPRGPESLLVGAPVAEGAAVQIVDGALGPDTRLDPDPSGFEKHVGYTTALGIDHAARAEARRATSYEARLSGNAIYVRGDDVRDRGLLHATVTTTQSRARHAFFGIAAAFAAVVVGLLVALRRLRHAASVERADALLAAEIDRDAL
jgi:hypothetical protein